MLSLTVKGSPDSGPGGAALPSSGAVTATSALIAPACACIAATCASTTSTAETSRDAINASSSVAGLWTSSTGRPYRNV
jgi:hypothetical protein